MEVIVHVFQNGAYIGDCQDIIKLALRTETVIIPAGKMISVTDGVISFIDLPDGLRCSADEPN